MHAATILPDPAGPLPRVSAAKQGIAVGNAPLPDAAHDAAFGSTVRRRRSALDFDARTPPMGGDELEQLLDFATRDWRADWRGNFGGENTMAERCVDLVELYLYVHRVQDCEPAFIGGWPSRKLSNCIAATCSASRPFSASTSPRRKFLFYCFHGCGFERGCSRIRQPRLPLRLF